MIYLLDTNACIAYLNRPMSGIRQRLETISSEDVAVCSVVKGELFYGAMRSNNPERTLAIQQEFLNRFISLPFDDSAAIIYSRIRAQLAALGTPIGPYDLQIAAIAFFLFAGEECDRSFHLYLVILKRFNLYKFIQCIYY